MTDFDDQLIIPTVWGPHGWKFIHYVTLGYPENPTPYQKERYKTFLLLLQDVLPCSLCANHYKENLQKRPLTNDILNSRHKLIKWGIDIHNDVNEMNNKPIINYVDAIKLIDTDAQCKPNIIEIIKDNKPINLETFNDYAVLNNTNNESYLLINQPTPEKITPEKITPVKTKSMIRCINNNNNNINNNNIVYVLFCIFIGLIFIAIIYKK